jgi:hypothetical protein
MTETDIQRYAREIAAVDLTTFDLSHPTTTEYRLAHEVVRMRAILAALREPSEKVLLAAVEAVSYGASYAALMRCIPAAVAAAEKETTTTTPPHA